MTETLADLIVQMRTEGLSAVNADINSVNANLSSVAAQGTATGKSLNASFLTATAGSTKFKQSTQTIAPMMGTVAQTGRVSLGTLTSGFTRLLGPIGFATAAVGALGYAVWRWGKASEEAAAKKKKALEDASKAVDEMRDKYRSAYAELLQLQGEDLEAAKINADLKRKAAISALDAEMAKHKEAGTLSKNITAEAAAQKILIEQVYQQQLENIKDKEIKRVKDAEDEKLRTMLAYGDRLRSFRERTAREDRAALELRARIAEKERDATNRVAAEEASHRATKTGMASSLQQRLISTLPEHQRMAQEMAALETDAMLIFGQKLPAQIKNALKQLEANIKIEPSVTMGGIEDVWSNMQQSILNKSEQFDKDTAKNTKDTVDAINGLTNLIRQGIPATARAG